MSVLVEAITVVVPLETLRSKYPGGPEAYERDCPNRTYCADEFMSRVGFMAPDDVRRFVERLQLLGFTHLHNGRAVDLVVVDQLRGPTSQCDWLEAGRHPDGYSAAWKSGTIPGWFAHPAGWTPRQSGEMQFVGTDEAKESLLRLTQEPGMDVVLDFRTGKEVYVGRTNASPDAN
jgi:hypothetical protein